MSYETILVETQGAVTVVTINRPQALNALSTTVLADLIAAFAAFDADPTQLCAVVTGSGDKAFAAGADIKEMADKPTAQFYAEDFFSGWQNQFVKNTRKPWIAAVNGFALGGGCEVAMMADFIIASENAKFGQPEIKLGVGPGMGGSQRLTRAVGKAKAMDMCLTGRMMDAAEAERSGLVSRVVPHADLMTEALKAAQAIRDAAACGHDEQGNGQPGVRDHARPGHPGRTPHVPAAYGHAGQGRRHGCLRRKAPGRLAGPLKQKNKRERLHGGDSVHRPWQHGRRHGRQPRQGRAPGSRVRPFGRCPCRRA